MIQRDNLKLFGKILKPLRRSQRKMIILLAQGIAWMTQAALLPLIGLNGILPFGCYWPQ